MGRFWGSPGIAPEPGLAATELVEALEEDRIKVLWIVATNPVVSQPDAGRFAAALRRAELVIAQDAYFPTETGALAHMILPAAQWPEKDGTMTNSERRVSLVQRALDPPGDALPDWDIFARVGRALGHREAFPWRTAAAVHAEYVQTTEGRAVRPDRASRTRGCGARARSSGRARRAEHPGTERLYASRRFATDDGRARLAPTPHTRARRSGVARLPAHADHGPRRAAVAHDDPHRQVAVAAGGRAASVRRGAPGRRRRAARRAVRVRSRRGSAVLRLRVSENVPRGVASRRSTGARCTSRRARAR